MSPTMHCPTNPEHKTFITTVHEIHDWEVDAEGNFIRDLGCSDSHKPDHGNIWTCSECGAEGVLDKDYYKDVRQASLRHGPNNSD